MAKYMIFGYFAIWQGSQNMAKWGIPERGIEVIQFKLGGVFSSIPSTQKWQCWESENVTMLQNWFCKVFFLQNWFCKVFFFTKLVLQSANVLKGRPPLLL